MKKYIWLWLMLLVGASQPVMAKVAPKAGSLWVMTYNIRVDVDSDVPRWAERRDPMINQIRFYAPDIFGLQEARPEAVDYLADHLKTYSHYGLGRDDGKVGEATTIFYNNRRFKLIKSETQWCSSTPDVPSKDADAALPRTFTRLILRDKYSGKLLDVRNTHFDHVGVKARENCAQQITALKAYRLGRETARVIVMGDFNVGEDTDAYRFMLSSSALRLKDARTISDVVFGPKGSFNGFDIFRNDGFAIDHIFVGPALKVKKFGVITDNLNGKVISDHYPVLAQISYY